MKAAGHAIGVDMTPGMLAKARHNILQYPERTGLDNVEFRLGEIEHLPVADNTVDVVLSNCVINLSPDKPLVWKEILRVLKSGGKLSVPVGCVAGAVLVDETLSMLEKTGFSDIVLTPKSGYIRQMQNWNDPLCREIAVSLPEGEKLENYVVSLSIEARKP